MDDSTRSLFKNQDECGTLLVSHHGGVDNWMKCCPVARTMEGWSETLSAWVIIQVRCKRWGCPICGRRKVQHYAQKVATAKPNRFITLTCWTELYESPREAFDQTRRAIPKFMAKLRNAYGEFECFRVLEATKKGWPHYHMIARCPYIPQPELVTLWRDLTGNKIVDVRAIDKTTHAYWYVVKYLAKQQHIPWTDRRCTWTKAFFPEPDFESGESLNIMALHFANAHPADHVRWCYEGCTLERHSADCFIVRGRKA